MASFVMRAFFLGGAVGSDNSAVVEAATGTSADDAFAVEVVDADVNGAAADAAVSVVVAGGSAVGNNEKLIC